VFAVHGVGGCSLVGGGGLCSPLVWGRGGPCLPLVGGLWWAMFIVRRGSVGADSGLLSSFVGAGSWGGARPCLPLVGWCWYWAVVVVGGVVMGHCQCLWGGGVVLGLGPRRRCWGW